MQNPDRLYFTSPDPDFIYQDFARVEANGEHFPKDATVEVVVDGHLLVFEIEPKETGDEQYALTLVEATPPLPPEIPIGAEVEGGILKKTQEFRLRPKGSRLGGQAFKALSIYSNVEVLVL